MDVGLIERPLRAKNPAPVVLSYGFAGDRIEFDQLKVTESRLVCSESQAAASAEQLDRGRPYHRTILQACDSRREAPTSNNTGRKRWLPWPSA